MRWVGALTAVTFAAAVMASATAGASATNSPAALRASIVAAIRAQHALHYVTTSKNPEWRTTMVCDIGVDRGLQRITVRRRGAIGHFTDLVVPGTAYLRGDVVALRDFFHYSAKQASRYAHRWISIPRGEFNYAMVASDVTLRSFIADHVPHEGRLTVVKGNFAGRELVGLRGTNAVFTQTLYVRSETQPLPVEFKDSDPGQASTEEIAIGPWNRSIHIRKPTHAVSDLTVLNS